MNKTKFDKLFKKKKLKNSSHKKSSEEKTQKKAPLKEVKKKNEEKAIIESLKTSISRELNNKDKAKKAALIIEEMLKSKKEK